MTRYLVAKLVGALGSVFGASVLSFWLMRVIPGDPAKLLLGPAARDPKTLEAMRRSMGLDQPMVVQYGRYINDFMHGRWGRSFKFGEEVMPLIRRRLSASVELGLTAFVLATLLATVAAVLTTYRRRRSLERLTNGVAHVGLGVPPFWLGLMLLIVFYVNLHWLPGPGRLSAGATPPQRITGMHTVDFLLHGNLAGWWDASRHLLLPAISLGIAPGAFLYRLLRANLADVADSPYLLVARTKGVPRLRAFVRHAVPNAVLPTLTASGLLLGQMLGGSVLVEGLFTWPGIGAAVTEGIRNQDFSVVQAFVLLSALIFVVISVGIDVLYGVIDPRLRSRGAR